MSATVDNAPAQPLTFRRYKDGDEKPLAWQQEQNLRRRPFAQVPDLHPEHTAVPGQLPVGRGHPRLPQHRARRREAAGGRGAAVGPRPSVSVNAGYAAASGQALDATCSTSVSVNFNAGSAAASGQANGVTAKLSNASGSASASGTANNVSGRGVAHAGYASAVGAAYLAIVNAGAQGGIATGTASVLPLTGTVKAGIGAAAAAGQAWNAAVLAVSAQGYGGPGSIVGAEYVSLTGQAAELRLTGSARDPAGNGHAAGPDLAGVAPRPSLKGRSQ